MSELAQQLFSPGIRRWVVDVRSTDREHVIIDRRGRFGNPFRVSHFDGPAGGRLACGLRYIRWLRDGAPIERYRPRWVLSNLWRLRGEKLGCHCAPDLCHGLLLAELAYAECTVPQKLRALERRLRKARRRLGLHISKFERLSRRVTAAKAGLSVERVAALEEGRRLATADELYALAEALGVIVEALETGERQVDDDFDRDDTTMHPNPNSKLRR
ncbi:MAG: DUF4326 domain-containing protein [Bradymonadaceae bacterium]